jgi:hypothetical protein
LLRHRWNRFVLEEVIALLTIFRKALDKAGFVKEKPSILEKLYGLDGAGPTSLFHSYGVYWELASSKTETDKEELKKRAVADVDSEIQRLRGFEAEATSLEDQSGPLETTAALLPTSDDLDRIIRREVHISREIDRTLNRLEKLQRRRKGQPEPPKLEVRLEE